MKRFLCVLMVCTGVFCACGKTEQEPDKNIAVEQEKSDSAEKEEEEEPEIEMEAEKGELPYTIRLEAGLPIYAEASYDVASNGVIERTTIYSIVEEKADGEGNVWGKLKSGAGWIDLDAMLEAPASVTISRADAALLNSGKYYEFIADNIEGMEKIAIRAKEPLKDVTLWDMELTETGMVFGNTLYTQETLTSDKPLVVGVVFWGDMTTYGVSFTDSSGQKQQYTLSISGRNGDLVCSPYTA